LWNSSWTERLDAFQFALDVVGCIPGFGEPFDALNAGISLLRRDWFGAGASAISVLPVAGDAIGKGAKLARLGVRHSDKLDEALAVVRRIVREASDEAPALGSATSLAKNGKRTENVVDAARNLAPNSAADDFVNGWRRLTVDDVPLPGSVRSTFRGGTAVGRVLDEDIVLYRVFGGKAGRTGSYLTRVKPKSAAEAIRKLALDPDWGNSAVHLVEVRVPKGTVIWEGAARHQGALRGGGSQIWISSEQLVDDWFRVIPWGN
jgi:hypothetical protein